MTRFTFVQAVALICGLSGLSALVYWALQYSQNDQESETISDQTRRSSPGSFLRTSGGFTHYELAGPAGEAGRTVVFVHGFSVPYYLFDPTFEAAARAGFRVLRYDLFGRGLSDRPSTPNDSNFFDRQLSELLDSLSIRSRIDIVGSSMGGPIAATFACRHPDRVRTVSLFDPGFSHGQPMPPNLRLPFWGEYTMAVQIAPHLAENQLSDFLHPTQFPDWPARYRPQMKYKGFRASLLSTLRNYLAEDWSQGFSCIGAANTPVFLVWGKKDRDMPFEVSRQVLAVLKNAEFLPVEDAAHVPFLEHPEIVNPPWLAFLGKN